MISEYGSEPPIEGEYHGLRARGLTVYEEWCICRIPSKDRSDEQIEKCQTDCTGCEFYRLRKAGGRKKAGGATM